MSESVCIAGVDVGGTAIKCAIVRSDGRVERAQQVPTEVDLGPEAAVARVMACLRTLLAGAGLSSGAFRAVGVSSAGIVDTERNVVLDAPNLRSWENYPLADSIGNALGVPAILENDVNAMAYGEWQCGAGRGARDLLCLTLGTGLGGGLVMGGVLQRGASGAAGEIGHMTVSREGPPCPCGSTGCLERYVGARWIVERALQALAADCRPSRLRGWAPADLTPRVLGEAADAGDAIATEVLAETGRWLGVGLASLVNVLNPERIVVGGGVAAAGERILGPARQTIRERSMAIPAAAAEVVRAALGNDAAVVGAALLAAARVQTK